MRTPMIAGNWKMNTTLAEASVLVKEIRAGLEHITGVETVLCPPFLSLPLVKELLLGLSIKVGAQNMHFEDRGAYTGEISPLMLCGICEYVILGHSERRQYFGETDEIVNDKIRSALAVELKPILCVGERLEQKESGKTEEVVTRQVRGALNGIESLIGLVIAYEPIWAIGTGRAETGEGANAIIAIIRNIVARLYGEGTAQEIRILYGGSVTAANIAEYVRQSEIDGALVGGASLKAKEFLTIVAQTAATKK
ncbi:MAG: triose-phosphate isomerase [Dehalococcoidia bacterium]|nr:triose-phosphate isomerase [Dehalococcoidia bacterium]